MAFLALAHRLRAAGHSAYIAGGWVRDAMLGRPANDVDIATSASITNDVSGWCWWWWWWWAVVDASYCCVVLALRLSTACTTCPPQHPHHPAMCRLILEQMCVCCRPAAYHTVHRTHAASLGSISNKCVCVLSPRSCRGCSVRRGCATYSAPWRASRGRAPS